MVVSDSLSAGQQEARMRWGTQESGSAFDRKKTPYLTKQAQTFLAQRAFCVVAGPEDDQKPGACLIMSRPGFVQVPDQQTCVLQLDSDASTSSILQAVRCTQCMGRDVQLSLCFISHSTRERLCIQGSAELISYSSPPLLHPFPMLQKTQLRLHVRQAFFHCAKYIRVRLAGLTASDDTLSDQSWRQQLPSRHQYVLTEGEQAFLARQVVCFLCTVDAGGQYAVNHRGGAPQFLVPLPPDTVAPGGKVLLPDYAGNGAFEAIGNILETGKAALLVPDYAAQLALRLSGAARVLEAKELPAHLAKRCPGAERVIMIQVAHVETQQGNWSATLAYERAYAEAALGRNYAAPTCPLP